jgi:hypothetical protein
MTEVRHRAATARPDAGVSAEAGLGAQVGSFRAARRNLEASVLSLATSVDGRLFSFQAPLHDLRFQVGGYVVLEGDGAPRLGQVITLGLDRLTTEVMLPTSPGGAAERRTQVQVQVQYARGGGTILAGDWASFHDVPVRPASGAEVQAWLLRTARPSAKLRLGNLGIERFGMWARGEVGSVLDAVHDQGVRCVVVDLGSLPTREEQSLVAGAHSACPAEPPDELVAMGAEHAIRIAAEGRKFGLYLLVSTQRPQKIAENVLSQADHLVLLRLNSLADASFSQAAFSFVPPSLVQRSVTFHQGEALIAGRIPSQAALLRFGARITEEGGADVPATWAAAR